MSARRRPHGSRKRAGFTLIEMMVAMTIGALIIASVYTLGGTAARDFHDQQRITQLQLATRLALDRVRRDVERAGLHGTPDSRLERGPGTASGTRVVAVALTNNDSTGRAAIDAAPAGAENSTTQADLLTLVGNFSTADAYLVRSLNGAGNSAFLQTSWQGFRRSFADIATDPSGNTIDGDLFGQVFSTGRLLHIQTLTGNHFFVTVVGTSVGPGSATVDFTPAIGVGGTAVGGLGEGALIAPLSIVRYGLAANPPDVPPPAAGDVQIYGPNVGLVRTELAADGTVINERTVLEWAVHFDVDAILDRTPLGGVPDARQLAYFDDAAAATAVANDPQDVRALVVTVGARTREQEPDFAWVAPTAPTPPAVASPLARFRVFSDRTGAAQVRTATAEIGLPNLIHRGL